MGEWTRLPDVAPKEIEAARSIKILLTGDLNRDIITNPFFYGKEKNYLRAQIARVTHGTTLLARAMWKIDEADPRNIAPEEGPEDGSELPLPTTAAMANPTMWAHGVPNILKNCKTQHQEQEEAPADWDPEKEYVPEDYLKMLEAEDPYEPLLKPITADSPVGLSEKIKQPAWSVRLLGDPEEYKHEEVDGPQSVPTKSYGVVVVRSLVWPGSLTFYYQGRIIQFYVGNLHKWEYGKHFFPVVTPDINSDPDEYQDGDEPNPKEAPEEEVAAGEGEEEGEDEKDEAASSDY